MTEDSKHDADHPWLEYIRLVRSLTAEMDAALSALARNDLQQFESSVAAQERLCETERSVLQHLRRNLPPGKQFSLAAPKQLVAAGRDLRQQNRVYAAVLARGTQVCRALLSVYQESRGYSQEGRIAPPTHTWSCEV
jgi:hypothetical protein